VLQGPGLWIGLRPRHRHGVRSFTAGPDKHYRISDR